MAFSNFIEKGLKQKQRLIELNNIARAQLKSLSKNKNVKKLENLNEYCVLITSDYYLTSCYFCRIPFRKP